MGKVEKYFSKHPVEYQMFEICLNNQETHFMDTEQVISRISKWTDGEQREILNVMYELDNTGGDRVAFLRFLANMIVVNENPCRLDVLQCHSIPVYPLTINE